MPRVEINKAELERLYVEQGLSMAEIAAILECDASTVYSKLWKAGIPTRKSPQQKAEDAASHISYEQLYDFYVRQYMSMARIGEMCGVRRHAVSSLLKRYGIQRRPCATNRKARKRAARITPGQIAQCLYHDELTIEQTAERLGVHPNTIKGRMRKWGIPPRNKLEKRPSLNPWTIRFIDGLLLGDGHLKPLRARRSAYQHTDKHRGYISWLANCFTELGIWQSGDIAKTQSGTYQFFSVYHPSLAEQRERWYPDGYKRIPPDLKLTPTVVRNWYIGDGHLTPTGLVEIYTQGFPVDDVDYLSHLLNESAGINSYRAMRGEGPIIRIRTVDTPSLLDYMGDCPSGISATYGYKWDWKGRLSTSSKDEQIALMGEMVNEL